MSNQMPPYPEEQRWYSQPRANYPDGDGYGKPPQPQVGYQGQTPASPYPGSQGTYPQQPASPYPGSQGTYPQQQDFAGNNLYTGNNSFASSNPYAVPPAAPTMYQPPAAPTMYQPPVAPTMYQPPAAPYAPPPVPGAYASPYMAPYGMADSNAGKATTGLVFGIITVVLGLTGWLFFFLLRGIALFGFIPFFVFGILGIVFSALGRRSATKRGIATTGLVLSIIGLVVGILIFIALLLIGLAILNAQTQ